MPETLPSTISVPMRSKTWSKENFQRQMAINKRLMGSAENIITRTAKITLCTMTEISAGRANGSQ